MTTFKRRLKIALVLAALPAIGSVPSRALPVTGLGYYEESATKTCSNASTCSVSFSALAGFEKLLLVNLRCGINITGGQKNSLFLTTLVLTGNGNVTFIENNVLVSDVPSTQTSRKLVAGSSAPKLFSKEQKPTVTASFQAQTSQIVLSCNLVGRTA